MRVSCEIVIRKASLKVIIIVVSSLVIEYTTFVSLDFYLSMKICDASCRKKMLIKLASETITTFFLVQS